MVTRETLPPATTDLDRAAHDLQTHGVCRVEGALHPSALAAIQRRLREVAEAEDAAGHSYRYDQGDANQRVWMLLNKGPEFVDLVQHPTAIGLVRNLLDGSVLLSGVSANITGPGGTPMTLHTDQQYLPPPYPPVPLGANALWMLTDFTERNGATHVVPGSHRFGGPPPPDTDAESVPLVGSAGTLVVFESRLWHKTGPNTTDDEHRIGIFTYYTRPMIRSQDDYARALDPTVHAAATPLLRELIGEVPAPGFGYVDGPPPEWPKY